MQNNSSEFSFNFANNVFNINFLLADVVGEEFQDPVENQLDVSGSTSDLVEFEINSVVNIEPTENGFDETSIGQDVTTLEHLYPSYRFSRDAIVKRIKECHFFMTKRGQKPSRVYWTGRIFHEIRRMLTEVIGRSDNSETSVDNEEDIYTLSRENFLSNMFWTKIDLALLCDRQLTNSLTITYDEFEFVRGKHETFLASNGDLVGVAMHERVGDSSLTPKTIVDAFIFSQYTDELFR